MRYARHFRRRRLPWVPYLAAAGLFLALAYVAGSRLGGRGGAPAVHGPAEPAPAAADEPSSAAVRIAPGTRFVYVTQYASTGRVEQEVSAPPPSMLDLTREALAAVYPQWEIDAFSDEQVVLRRTDTGVDPATLREEAARYRTLALRGGNIVVLAGRPHPEAGLGLEQLTLLRETGLSAATLLATEAERLGRGVVVDGDEELARSLEGYLN